MPDAVIGPAPEQPSLCLNMIVRNETHIVAEVLDAAAPYISSWVIVDTGSDDGTQDLIRNHMAGLGIPGELCERPWRNFGHNRTEALSLAQGHGDYIWVIDADDLLVGTPNFAQLDADIYWLRCGARRAGTYWQPWLFRDGVNVRWVGVTHEYAVWDRACTVANLEGDYRIEIRSLSIRNQSGQKFGGDRDLLLAEVERNPTDARSVFYLADSYRCLGDWGNARQWYARRAEMGGSPEEVYFAKWRVAESMSHLGAPWPDVQDAYLQAWEFRPTRAEPLYDIARRCRENQRYQLGYQFAKMAAEIPAPEGEVMWVRSDVYAWRAIDEQAVCASWTGRHPEAFTLWRRALARADIPAEDRQRIASNRDVCVPAMIDAASPYPQELVQSLIDSSGDAEVTVSLIAGPDRATTEHTLNSFVNCCTDVLRVGRFLVLDAGLSTADRAMLLQRYGFLEFLDPTPDAPLAQIRAQVNGRFWLHLGQGWRFFAPENFITRLTAVLDAEPQVCQVGINFTDAVKLTGTSAAEDTVRRAPNTGRYVRTDTMATGPAMFDTTRAATLGTASLDEVLCI